MASSPITSWQIYGETMEIVREFFFWRRGGGGGAPKSVQMVTTAIKLKDACSLEEKLMTNRYLRRVKNQLNRKKKAFATNDSRVTGHFRQPNLNQNHCRW